jgi:hypothetical protein
MNTRAMTAAVTQCLCGYILVFLRISSFGFGLESRQRGFLLMLSGHDGPKRCRKRITQSGRSSATEPVSPGRGSSSSWVHRSSVPVSKRRRAMVAHTINPIGRTHSDDMTSMGEIESARLAGTYAAIAHDRSSTKNSACACCKRMANSDEGSTSSWASETAWVKAVRLATGRPRRVSTVPRNPIWFRRHSREVWERVGWQRRGRAKYSLAALRPAAHAIPHDERAKRPKGD